MLRDSGNHKKYDKRKNYKVKTNKEENLRFKFRRKMKNIYEE